MKTFLKLFESLEETTKTNAKIEALVDFFEESNDDDKIWAIALFTHKRPKRTVNTTLLREWTAELTNIPKWLFEETYHIVGDLAETISLLLPHPKSLDTETSLTSWIYYITSLHNKEQSFKKEKIIEAWSKLDKNGRFLFNKLITGGFRVGVSKKTMINALSKHLDVDSNVIAHRLMGNWDPFNTSFQSLLIDENPLEQLSKPYPFYLAYALENEVESLGLLEDWFFEWKWDGIRSQLIHRNRETYLWSRGEELINESFPEFEILNSFEIPSFVLDGELLIGTKDEIFKFQFLQKRLGRKKVSKKTLDELPAKIIAYDLLEYKGEDLRERSQQERRILLEQLCSELNEQIPIEISPLVTSTSWEQLKSLREQSRDLNAEGFMIKSKTGSYKSGRKKGDWFKWKVDPMTVDAVMIYAQRGHGRRSNLFSDFTFAVWKDDKLVPFAKAYSGLSDVAFTDITRFVKNNTIEKYGPVSVVRPQLVFEIAFEGISESGRHKSGVAVRFPRIKRWRKDKKAAEANHLEDLIKLL